MVAVAAMQNTTPATTTTGTVTTATISTSNNLAINFNTVNSVGVAPSVNNTHANNSNHKIENFSLILSNLKLPTTQSNQQNQQQQQQTVNNNIFNETTTYKSKFKTIKIFVASNKNGNYFLSLITYFMLCSI